jgi:ubiquinone/menaquinone biosynthesis C-methylase UbiE
VSLTLNRQNQYRARYAQATPGWQPATQVYEHLIRQHCYAEMDLLDVGCGRGGVLEQLQDLSLKTIGVDPDFASLQEHRLPHLPRLVALADALPLKASSVDMLLAAWVLEHITTPQAVFTEIGRLLKPGGVFIFLTPNRHSLVTGLNRLLKPFQHQLVPRLYGRAEADTFPVVYRANTPHDLHHLAQTGGMILEDCRIIADPTYFAFHEVLYHLSVLLTRVLPASSGVHLVGVCRKV